MSNDYDLINAYEQLDSALAELKRFLQNTQITCRIFTTEHDDEAVAELTQSLTQIWHLKSGDGRRTENLYGLVGVPAKFIPLLHQINQRKQAFKQAVSHYKQDHKEPGPLLYKRACELHTGLQSAGLARLHLKQCYRLLPVLDRCPTKVTFSWYTSGQSQKKLTVQQAMDRLLKMDISQLHIQLQIEALNKLNEHEPLVQIQHQVPVMRANIAWKEDNGWIRKARNSPLPIFFPLDEEKNFPEYNLPTLTPPEKRSRQFRADSLIDSDLFLPSLRVHRYKDR